eukprot:37395-Amphidinium_carterae.1
MAPATIGQAASFYGLRNHNCTRNNIQSDCSTSHASGHLDSAPHHRGCDDSFAGRRSCMSPPVLLQTKHEQGPRAALRSERFQPE